MTQNNSSGQFLPLYWVYLAGFFLIIIQALNVIPFWSEPGDWGKSVVFRIISSVLLCLFIIQVISRKISLDYLRKKIRSISPFFISLMVLFLVFLLAAIFSPNPKFSLWGDPFRSGGFVNFGLYILFSLLLFLTVKDNDWRKLLDSLIIVGCFVSLVAIFQQFGILSNFFIPFTVRPHGTMGNPILLSIYLLLLTFLPISFALKERIKLKKYFYSLSSLLFVFVAVFLTQTRGTYLGFLAGFLFFFFLYPQKTKKIRSLKIYGALFFILLIISSFSLKVYLDNHLNLYQKLPPLLSSTLDRALGLFEGAKIGQARASVWQISWEAFKERPILGYGLENFPLAFDKYYDPSLPKIGQIVPGEELWQWFDRAHNVFFETLVTGGTLGFAAYIALFVLLLWFLQRLKKRGPTDSIISHGIQATFIGYLVALFSAFDSPSTYITFFLYRNPVVIAILMILVWFIIDYNIKPLLLNKELNFALGYADLRKELACKKALDIVNNTYPKSKTSIIDNYIGQKSTLVIYGCNNMIKEVEKDGETKIVTLEDLTNQNIEILKENIKRNPQYTTNWVLIGEYTNILIKEKNEQTENVFIETEETKKLKEDADFYFETANRLSPRRQIILRDWGDFYSITGDYQKAEEKLQKCIDLNPSYAACYWYMAINKGYQKDYDGFKEIYNLAKENGYGVELAQSLKELINMYIRNSDYQGIAETLPKLIPFTEDPMEKAQQYASLAAAYQELGEIELAIQAILKIKEEVVPLLPPTSQEAVLKDVEILIKILSS